MINILGQALMIHVEKDIETDILQFDPTYYIFNNIMATTSPIWFRDTKPS